jgi:hypothetical protein
LAFSGSSFNSLARHTTAKLTVNEAFERNSAADSPSPDRRDNSRQFPPLSTTFCDDVGQN